MIFTFWYDNSSYFLLKYLWSWLLPHTFCVAQNDNIMMERGAKHQYVWGSRSHHTIDWDTVVDICVWWSVSKPFHLGRWEAVYCRLLARTVGIGERKRGKLTTVTSPKRHGVSNHQQRDCYFQHLVQVNKNEILHSWLFVRVIHRWWPVDSLHKGPVMQ